MELGLGGIQSIAHGFGQSQVSVGFLKKYGMALAEKGIVKVVHTVAAGEDNLEAGIMGVEFVG